MTSTARLLLSLLSVVSLTPVCCRNGQLRRLAQELQRTCSQRFGLDLSALDAADEEFAPVVVPETEVRAVDASAVVVAPLALQRGVSSYSLSLIHDAHECTSSSRRCTLTTAHRRPQTTSKRTLRSQPRSLRRTTAASNRRHRHKCTVKDLDTEPTLCYTHTSHRSTMRLSILGDSASSSAKRAGSRTRGQAKYRTQRHLSL